MSAGSVRAGRAYVELFADNSRLIRGLRRAQSKLRAWGSKVQQWGRQLLTVGAAAAAPFAFATKTFADFSDQMAQVRAVTGANEKDFAALNQQAKELGRTTSYTASEVAAAMTELGRAGYKPAEILAAMPSMLDLARGTATDLARAAEITAASMRGFNLTAEDTTSIADVLTATANNSAQGLEEIGESMKYVAPFASEAGESILDTAAALGVMASNGVKGSMAGTALARAYKNISKEDVQKKIAALGVSAVDSAGNLRKVSRILAELGKATAGMGSARRLGIFEQLFGRGSQAALKLSKGEKFEDLQRVLQQSAGTARKTAKTMDDTLGGSFRMLASAAEGAMIAIGESLAPVIRQLSEWITSATTRVAEWVEQNREVILTVAAVVAGLLAVGAALTVAGFALKGVAAVMGLLTGVFKLFNVVLVVTKALLLALASPIGIIVAAVAALAAWFLTATGAMGKAANWLGRKFQQLKDFAGKSFQGIADALKAGDYGLAAKILWLSLRVAWESGIKPLKEMWASFKYWFIETGLSAWYELQKGLATIWAGLKKGWNETCRFFQWAWNGLVKNIQKAGSWLWDQLRKGWEWVAGKVTGKSDEEIAAKQKAIDEEGRKFAESLDAEYNAMIQRQDADRAREQQEHDDYIAGLNEQKADALAMVAKDKAKEIADAQNALDAATKEWQDAIEEARRKREAAEKGMETGEGPPGLPEAPPALTDAVKKGTAAAAGLVEKLQGALSSRGTFSSVALAGLAAGDVTDRIARASEETARNTKRIREEVEDGGGEFI